MKRSGTALPSMSHNLSMYDLPKDHPLSKMRVGSKVKLAVQARIKGVREGDGGHSIDAQVDKAHVLGAGLKSAAPRMWCPKCGTSAKAAFCPNCGEKMVKSKAAKTPGADQTSDEDQDD